MNKEIKKKSNLSYFVLFMILGILTAVFFAANICTGSVNIGLDSLTDLICGRGGDDTVRSIIVDIRLPRTIAAFFLGGALALSGYLLQTYLYNPIAGPFILGISSGAKMTVAVAMMVFMNAGIRMNSFTLIMAAFVGSMISMLFVLFLSDRVGSMAMLVISGMMIGYICSAITDLIVTFADDANIVNLHNWSRGSFSGMNHENAAVIAVVIPLAFTGVLLLAKPISAWQMGESYAVSVGVNLKAVRFAIVILSGILSACTVAFAGPVSFVGVAAPHLVRRMFGTVRPMVMIPACFMSGAVFCLFCDLLARTVMAPTELGISTVTAVFGAPVVLAAVIERRASRMR
ncbi:MAG: iron ABC transporter permease [Lachnospiraceae bacterium]|nr:iron ABC transporter permease [Lachnospiraceae bacterium]